MQMATATGEGGDTEHGSGW
uniref:Uncharacterized protein n=1 Tax=Arundo donax TaxID=35708 RepID=A0A0A9FFR7_ARUDO